jgi:hypothetical protein
VAQVGIFQTDYWRHDKLVTIQQRKFQSVTSNFSLTGCQTMDIEKIGRVFVALEGRYYKENLLFRFL